MIRTALVEDDDHYRQEIMSYLERFSSESEQKFHVTSFRDGIEIARDYKPVFDLILMDIEMEQMDGMTAAEKIREIDHDVVIIFITNMPQYVMKGYLVDALDYVLKPVTYFAFTQRISRALERMKRRMHHFLALPIHNGIVRLDIGDITYVEIINHMLIYHTRENTYECKGSLTEVAERLEAEHFFRISNCYLVNLEYVESVHSTEALVAGNHLSVSRTRKKPLLDALNNYMNEVSK